MKNNPPAKPGNESTNVSYSGATTFSSDTTKTNESYTSSQANQNAVLVSGGTVNLSDFSLTKTGSASGGDSADFYGTNAAILSYNSAVLNISNANIETNAEHANAVFAYGDSTINISNSTITTSSNTSGGVMVTGGGKLNATNVTVTTSGNSSAAIRSDRGGGTLTVTGGSYTTHGMGSPAVYSTADITVNKATLLSDSSEGVVIEGKNSVKLNSVTLTDTNTTLNGNSETYKNIFIYQSMSGDASEGTGNFEAVDSTIITNKGDNFFVTNTTATISLKNTTITNNDESGVFLRAQAGKWGNSGSNGGKVSLSATDQNIYGDIIVDNISSITLSLSNSYYKGAMLGDGAKTLTLSEDSVFVLTADTTIDSLSNEASDNMNIYANGFSLTVAGQNVEINQNEAPETNVSSSEASDVATIGVADTDGDGFVWWPFAVGGGVLLVAVITIVAIVVMRKKKHPKNLDITPTIE